jgi:hypothetical protein
MLTNSTILERNMSDTPTTYRPSGGVIASRFIPWTILLVVLGIGVGVLLHVAYVWDLYYFIATPICAALPLFLLMRIAVRNSHCRHAGLIAIVGLFVGVVLIFTQYFTDFLGVQGVQAAGQLGQFVEHVKERMDSDLVGGNGGGIANRWLRWALFIADALVILGGLIGVGVYHVGEPYCEICHRWMSSTKRRFKLDVGERLLGGLSCHDVDAVR